MSRAPEQIDPVLLWGCWLTLSEDRRGSRFTDDEGRSWPTLRAAFWEGRMGMTTIHPSHPDEMMEQMLAVLVALSRKRTTDDPAFLDLFDGNRTAARHYFHWLKRERMILAESFVGGAEITNEGRAAMLMLHATRPHVVAAIRPSSASIEQLVFLGRGADLGEPGRRDVEEQSKAWKASFRRGLHCRSIVLVARIDEAGLPVKRTVWSIDLQTREQCNHLYDWLCDRLDRWDEWSKLAWQDGGEVLTRRLLSMTVLTERMKLLADNRVRGH